MLVMVAFEWNCVVGIDMIYEIIPVLLSQVVGSDIAECPVISVVNFIF